MRIVIDMQGAQTESRFRGIGRYSLSLALAVARRAREHEIWLVLNAAFPESALEIRCAFEGIVSAERIRTFQMPTPVSENEPANFWRARVGEKIREYCIAAIKPDAVLLTSLFEGYVDDAVVSISDGEDIYTATILYDLIPFLHPEKYLTVSAMVEYYKRKIHSLKNADLLLSISEHSRIEAIEALGLNGDKIVNISTAIEPYWQERKFLSQEVANLYKKFSITKKIILYVPGGGDSRKNFERLIRAYGSLSDSLRLEHQLVIVGNLGNSVEQEISSLKKELSFFKDEILLTGYVTDDVLNVFYQEATLFVFASLHEGFGLPVLEAMSCGAPVIASQTTSLPEVVGNKEALFDPYSFQSIADKMQQALEDEAFRLRLKKSGLAQAKTFSWNNSADRLIKAFEQHFAKKKRLAIKEIGNIQKPRLAFVSPLPPERTGIADYSVELLLELSKYFEIEIIVSQSNVQLPKALSHLPLHSDQWFLDNGCLYDKILYHFGNSPFHSHMFKLLRRYPGIVVLHDFFLSNLLAYEEMTENMPNAWVSALYDSHGYLAVQERFQENNRDNVKLKYPCNLDVLENARGVIVHSENSKRLAAAWYGSRSSENWAVIPLLRQPAPKIERLAARKALGIKANSFVVCSFGAMDFTKLNHVLLDAWFASLLSKDPECELIFVGPQHGGEYGSQINSCISKNKSNNRVHLTDWISMDVYRQYLQAADVAVQLRCLSRGETSAAVLDAMNYGLATVVNGHGAMADLPEDAVLKLPDIFTEKELVLVLEMLWQDRKKCSEWAAAAKNYSDKYCEPSFCGKLYVEAIEAYYERDRHDIDGLLNSILDVPGVPANDLVQHEIAYAVANSSPRNIHLRQLLVDVSTLVNQDLKSGIERVVKAQLLELIKSPPPGFRVEPVYFIFKSGFWCCQYARKFSARLLGFPEDVLDDATVDIYSEDIFYALDFSPGFLTEISKTGLFLNWRAQGVQFNILVYDLLPVLKPLFFPRGASEAYRNWLIEAATFAHRFIGISNAVVEEVYEWLDKNEDVLSSIKGSIKLSAVPLGADVQAAAPTKGLPVEAVQVLSQLKATKSFLMVGTIEPRKGHLQTLKAFEQLWKRGCSVCLVIVGREGWTHLPSSERRTIPEIIDKIQRHPELGKKLFWLKSVSDEYLEEIYGASTCLLAASEGEGFGLPLIEAAKHKLPIIARDIPVFREVASNGAFYFEGLAPSAIANAVEHWLSLNAQKKSPSSSAIAWKSWAQSAKIVGDIFVNEGSRPELFWVSKAIRQKAADLHLILIHEARLSMVRNLLPSGDYILDLGGANIPLYDMEYPYSFKKLILIDLPPEKRHEYYQDIPIKTEKASGVVVIRYLDMTTLEGIEDESIDFVWSGQSIEHVPLDRAEKMCQEIFRVLKKGGAFCLDTPNRRLTEIHTRDIGGGFIHPEHYIEYYPEDLKKMLEKAKFFIHKSYGICAMPATLVTQEFHYEDFMFGQQIIGAIEDGYIQFYHCIK